MKWTGQGIHVRKEIDNLGSTEEGVLYAMDASMDSQNPIARLKKDSFVSFFYHGKIWLKEVHQLVKVSCT